MLDRGIRDNGEVVEALVFLPLATHAQVQLAQSVINLLIYETSQFAGHLSSVQKHTILHSATRGARGTSLEYLQQTLECLNQMGIQEPHLELFLKSEFEGDIKKM